MCLVIGCSNVILVLVVNWIIYVIIWGSCWCCFVNYCMVRCWSCLKVCVGVND